MIVFLLGTPGCGKSVFYRRLIKRLKDENIYQKFTRVDDFPKLWNIFMEDEKTGKFTRCRATSDGGYKVTDPSVWDDILKEVAEDVLKIKKEQPDTLLFIEFSRPNYVHSIRNNFHQEILQDAITVYLDVPFDICWERNLRRHQKALEAGTDDHLVSRDEMEETYGSDDKEKLKSDFRQTMPVIFIYPDSRKENDFKKLDEGVEKVVKKLKVKCKMKQ